MLTKERTITFRRLLDSRPLLVLAFLSYVVPAATIVIYAGLIGLGRWQLDEYFDFYWARKGFPFLLERLQWSPRPVSESLLFGYAWTVNHLHRPLIVPLLLALWVVFILAGLFTVAENRMLVVRHVRPHLLLALSLMALFLAGGHTTEVFYWPAGAIAYLPTLAASLLFFLQVIGGRLFTSRGGVVAGVCLLVAAGSSEAGATLAFFYGVVRAARWAWERFARQRLSERRPFLWWALPSALGAFLLLAVLANRFHAAETVPGQSAAGRPVASVVAGVQEMVVEIIGREMLANLVKARPDPHAWFHSGPRLVIDMVLGSRLWMELLLAAGVALCWSPFGCVSKELASQILELAAALLLACFSTIAAANLHFGATCCARHELLRECWLVMIIAGVTIASAAWTSAELIARRSVYAALAPVLLAAAVLSLGHLRPLFRTYAMYRALREAGQQNFESGFRENTGHMVFSVLPSAGIVTEETLVPGSYTALPVKISDFGYSYYPYYLLAFFDKQSLIIHPLETFKWTSVDSTLARDNCEGLLAPDSVLSSKSGPVLSSASCTAGSSLSHH
jgi:hypothetical protein